MKHPFEREQIEPWEVLEKRVVGNYDGGMLMWWLVLRPEHPRGVWAPVVVDVDGETITRWPTWAPLPGSQMTFLTCPITEALFAGPRGTGKTGILLWDFAKDVNKGWGSNWRGIIFRKQLGDLDDAVRQTKNMFEPLFPGFRFKMSKADYAACWPTGEELLFRHMIDETEYEEYHGHSTCGSSEVLTPTRGWVTLDDIQIGDAVYEVAPDRTLVESVVETKTVRRHNQGLVRVEGRGIFMEFTPEHKLGILYAPFAEKGVNWQKHPGNDARVLPVPYSEIGKEAYVARWVKWDSGKEIQKFELPYGASKQPSILAGDDYCKFMGWYLSEGTCSKEQCTFSISQSKPRSCKILEDFLSHCGFSWSTNFKYGNHTVCSKSWSDYLFKFGKQVDRFVPAEIKGAPVRQLQLFFDALMEGDGTRQGSAANRPDLKACNDANPQHTHERMYYDTISKQLADDVAEIALKLGYAVYIKVRDRRGEDHGKNKNGKTVIPKHVSYTVCMRKDHRRDFHLITDNFDKKQKEGSKKRNTNVKRVPYDGGVVSIGVPKYHTFLIRQKGCVWVSGNSYPFIAWEELTQWPNLKAYNLMKSCCRPTTAGIPTRIRANTNPSGAGHNGVKKYYHLPGMFGRVIREPNKDPRVAIQSSIKENFVLLHSDPGYIDRIKAAAISSAQADAWATGNWNVTEGGIIDDVWRADIHVIPNLGVRQIPRGWKLSRSYDHGQARPFACLWWAESNGEPIRFPDGRWVGQIPGDLILFMEWYGTNGEEDTGLRMPCSAIAQGIKDRERDNEMRGSSYRDSSGQLVLGGPADTELWSKANTGTGRAPIDDFQDAGVFWDQADKSHGSRVRGLTLLRERVMGATPNIDGSREKPGLFVCMRCRHWLDLVPSMPRALDNPDDIPKSYEDHLVDATRYRLTWEFAGMKRRSF